MYGGGSAPALGAINGGGALPPRASESPVATGPSVGGGHAASDLGAAAGPAKQPAALERRMAWLEEDVALLHRRLRDEGAGLGGGADGGGGAGLQGLQELVIAELGAERQARQEMQDRIASLEEALAAERQEREFQLWRFSDELNTTMRALISRLDGASGAAAPPSPQEAPQSVPEAAEARLRSLLQRVEGGMPADIAPSREATDVATTEERLRNLIQRVDEGLYANAAALQETLSMAGAVATPKTWTSQPGSPVSTIGTGAVRAPDTPATGGQPPPAPHAPAGPAGPAGAAAPAPCMYDAAAPTLHINQMQLGAPTRPLQQMQPSAPQHVQQQVPQLAQQHAPLQAPAQPALQPQAQPPSPKVGGFNPVQGGSLTASMSGAGGVESDALIRSWDRLRQENMILREQTAQLHHQQQRQIQGSHQVPVAVPQPCPQPGVQLAQQPTQQSVQQLVARQPQVQPQPQVQQQPKVQPQPLQPQQAGQPPPPAGAVVYQAYQPRPVQIMQGLGVPIAPRASQSVAVPAASPAGYGVPRAAPPAASK